MKCLLIAVLAMFAHVECGAEEGTSLGPADFLHQIEESNLSGDWQLSLSNIKKYLAEAQAGNAHMAAFVDATNLKILMADWKVMLDGYQNEFSKNPQTRKVDLAEIHELYDTIHHLEVTGKTATGPEIMAARQKAIEAARAKNAKEPITEGELGELRAVAEADKALIDQGKFKEFIAATWVGDAADFTEAEWPRLVQRVTAGQGAYQGILGTAMHSQASDWYRVGTSYYYDIQANAAIPGAFCEIEAFRFEKGLRIISFANQLHRWD